MRVKLVFLFFAGLIFIPGIVSAHSGGTDAYGCHTCRTNCPSYGLSYGEYHCHQSKGLPQPEYPIRSHDGWTEPWPDYSYPSIPSCPLFSSYDYLSKSCKCNYGYVAEGNRCISLDDYCQDQLGFNSRHNSLYDQCECSYGYVIDGGRCVDGDTVCYRKLGYNSNYNSLSNKCECDYGYVIGISGNCVSEDNYCQDLLGWNAEYKTLEDACGCKSGYVLNSSKTSCIDGNTYCWGLYGYNSTYLSYSKTCECDYGYEFRNGSCVEIEEEPAHRLPPSFYNAPEPEVITPKSQPLIPQPVSQPTLPQNSSLSEPETLEKEDNVATLPGNNDGGMTFDLIGNELLRQCAGFGCYVSKWGSVNGRAEIIKQDGEWFEVMITDNSGSAKGWFNKSLVPMDVQEIFKASLSGAVDSQKSEKETKTGFWKKLFWWFGF